MNIPQLNLLKNNIRNRLIRQCKSSLKLDATAYKRRFLAILVLEKIRYEEKCRKEKKIKRILVVFLGAPPIYYSHYHRCLFLPDIHRLLEQPISVLVYH
jgi:hypothetical protein